MKRLIPLAALAGLALAASAAAAEPASLVCTGRRTAPDPSTGAMKPQAVSFRLTLDAQARRVMQDDRAMVVRDWSDSRLVFSDYNPGILGALAGNLVTTLDLKTGSWRDKWGAGHCAPAPVRPR